MEWIWPLIIVVALAAYALRGSFIVLYGKFAEPPWLRRALRFGPPAVFAAFVSSSLLVRDGALFFDWRDARLWAAAMAAAVAWKTRSILATIVAGMLALMLLEHFLFV